MDFIELLNLNFDKLANKDIVKTLWMEMLNEKRSEEYLEQLVEYSFHYPVDSDHYLKELNEKFDELDKELLRTIDGRLKAYMITFLYYCTNRFSRTVPLSSTILATSLYIKLISLPDIGKYFFEANMFKIQLHTIATAVGDTELPESDRIYMLNLVKKYCLATKLEMKLFKGIMNTYIMILLTTAEKEIDDVNSITPLQMCCFNGFRDIILNETDGSRIRILVSGLFKCLGKPLILKQMKNRLAGGSTLKVFLRDILQEELDEDKFQYILDAFCLFWGKEDFQSYQDAVSLMNSLKVNYYKELVRKMVVYSQSRNHRRFLINIMHLIVAMAQDLPPFSLDKIQVFYSCVMRNILYHFMDSEKKIVDMAIDALSRLCVMNDNGLIKIVFENVNCTGKFVNLSLPAIFLSIKKVADEKWGITPRNQKLLIIMSKFLVNSSNFDNELVHKTLHTICKDCTPFSLKPSLDTLNELFCKLALKGEDEAAASVLKIIFKCAMHQDATSMEYALHIFNSMLDPTVINTITYHPKYFYNIFLSPEFEYEALFTKCQKKIRSEHVEKVILGLRYNIPKGAVLLCCLLKFNNYEDIDYLIRYFIKYFPQIANKRIMAPLSIAFRNILHNRTINQDDIPRLDILHSHLVEALFQQAYQIPSIKPAYDLLQKIRTILRIQKHDDVLEQLLVCTSERAVRRLHRREVGDQSVFMYLSELCLLMGKLPTPEVVTILEALMDDPVKVEEISVLVPDIYVQLLNLFTSLAMMCKRKVSKVLTYLKPVLHDQSQIYQVMAFKLYYSLCQEMTHEFEEVITFCFKEIVTAGPCLLRLIVSTIEELVYDDYIKLESETFFKFIHALGSDDLGIFMREVLMKRFLLSNQNDITKYYVQSIMYIHTYNTIPDYPISNSYEAELLKMKFRFNNTKDIFLVLFSSLAIKRKFTILLEISEIFSDIVRGTCKIDSRFFPVLKDLLMTFRFPINASVESKVERHYYDNVCKMIGQKIVKLDTKYKVQCYYSEYEDCIKKCTLSLLKLLFIENRQIAEMIQITLFDALIHWIDFVKDEIINYIHVERGKDYGQYFYKLINYYKRNKGKFVTPDSFSISLDQPSSTQYCIPNNINNRTANETTINL